MLGRKKDKPVRLEKKVSTFEKVQNWIDAHRFYLIILGIIIIMILLIVLLFFSIQSGTDSGLWYNHGVI